MSVNTSSCESLKASRTSQNLIVTRQFQKICLIKYSLKYRRSSDIFTELRTRDHKEMSLIDEINKIIAKKLQAFDDDAFFVLDVGNLVKQHQMWINSVPRVKPFYAIKSNDSEEVIKILASLGTGFDCASKSEIQKVLSIGVPPERIIFAHTTKQKSHILFARKVGVKKMTFDSQDELLKIKNIYPECELVLRIRYDSERSQISFGKKFGCDPLTEAPKLIKGCANLQMNLIGISFHVGSFCDDHRIFQNALLMTRRLFDFASELGIEMRFVDIGGGFVGNDENLMDKYAWDINQGVDKYFADEKFEIVSEPGRYFTSAAFTLVCNVIAKKQRQESNENDPHFEYYINDGIFNSFLGKFLGQKLKKQIFEVLNRREGDELCHSCVIWGQTCDIVDKLAENILMPELHVDDWLIVRNMGSYTVSTFVGFNGFERNKIYQIFLDKPNV